MVAQEFEGVGGCSDTFLHVKVTMYVNQKQLKSGAQWPTLPTAVFSVWADEGTGMRGWESCYNIQGGQGI